MALIGTNEFQKLIANPPVVATKPPSGTGFTSASTYFGGEPQPQPGPSLSNSVSLGVQGAGSPFYLPPGSVFPNTPSANRHDQLTAILKSINPSDWATGLGQQEANLNRIGVSLQKGSAGNIRGRLYGDLFANGQYDPFQDYGWTGGGGGGMSGGSGMSGGNVFSDAATSDWETLLRQISGQLQQPHTTEDYGPLTDYLRTYFNQLQQPGYTPAEQDLLQTQALDPLERQRQARIQQTQTDLARRGIAPSSGVFQQAVQDINRQFDQLRTQEQSQFASQNVAYDAARKQQATQIGGLLNQVEQGQFAGNENRLLQALSLMQQIPQLADQRLAAASGSLTQMNPLSFLNPLLSLQNSQQQQNQFNTQQTNQFWQNLGLLLAQSGLFG